MKTDAISCRAKQAPHTACIQLAQEGCVLQQNVLRNRLIQPSQMLGDNPFGFQLFDQIVVLTQSSKSPFSSLPAISRDVFYFHLQH